MTDLARTRWLLITVGVASLAATAVVGVVASPDVGEIVAATGEVVADLVALTLCAAVTLNTRWVARVAWAMATAAFGCWLLADSAYLAFLVSGRTVPAIGPIDVGWVAFSLLMLAFVGIVYARLRPEHGWQGVLDAASLVMALGALVWAATLRPFVRADGASFAASMLSVLYPAAALVGAATLGWLVLRAKGGPVWLRWILMAFALQFIAEAGYVALNVDSRIEVQGLTAVVFAACAWTWAIAALERLSWPQEVWAAGDRTEPPPWSHTIPAVVTLTAVGVLAWGDGLLGAAAFIAVAVAAVRSTWAIRMNAQLLAEKGAEATTDPLTGALNRRRLARELTVLTARARRHGTRLTALAVDLDGFKVVNDSFGHAAGDRLLVAVARALQACLREGDLLFRTGGDEFIVLLPDTGVAEGVHVAERLRFAVVGACEEGATVTASVGIAEGPPRRSPGEALLHDADAALYRAKSDGRDRVMIATGSRTGEPEATVSPA